MSSKFAFTLLSTGLLLLTGACGAADPDEGEGEPTSESELSAPDEKTMPELLDARRSLLSKLTSDQGNEACTAKWQPLTSDGRLDIVLAIGYTDAEFGDSLFTTDKSERDNVTSHLTAPCIPNYNACGFSVEKRDDVKTTLIKKVTGRDGSPVAVRVTLTHSSATEYDEDNRGKNRDAQSKQSQLAKSVFDEGLANADIVFYSGHARDGGGPDFGPPKLAGNSKVHVDYSWYQAKRPGISDLLAKLKAPGHSVKMIGLFACATRLHFNKSVLAADPHIGLIQSYKVTEGEVLQQSVVGALDAAIGMKCNDSFQKSVNVTDSRKIDLVNFF